MTAAIFFFFFILSDLQAVFFLSSSSRSDVFTVLGFDVHVHTALAVHGSVRCMNTSKLRLKLHRLARGRGLRSLGPRGKAGLFLRASSEGEQKSNKGLIFVASSAGSSVRVFTKTGPVGVVLFFTTASYSSRNSQCVNRGVMFRQRVGGRTCHPPA